MTTGITLQLYVPLSLDLEKNFNENSFTGFPRIAKMKPSLMFSTLI